MRSTLSTRARGGKIRLVKHAVLFSPKSLVSHCLSFSLTATSKHRTVWDSEYPFSSCGFGGISELIKESTRTEWDFSVLMMQQAI